MKYGLEKTKIRCPACEHAQGTILWTATASDAADHFCPESRDPPRHTDLRVHLESIWPSGVCRLVRCERCGLVSCDPFIAGDKTFYELFYVGQGSYPTGRWEFGAVAERIAEIAADPASVELLEVGAGDGAFLRMLNDDVVRPGRVTAIEYSPNGLARLESMGVSTLSVDFRDLSGPEYDARFRYICLFQTLEHLDRLDQAFETFSRIGDDDARVFISVPNNRRTDFAEQNGLVLDMPPNHVSRWTEDAFRRIAARHGWAVHRHRYAPATPMRMLKWYCYYRFLRRSRVSNGPAKWAAGIGHRRLRRALSTPLIVFNALPAAFHAGRFMRGDLGESQLVELVRIDEGVA